MNKDFEFHDTDIEKISQIDENVILSLDAWMIYYEADDESGKCSYWSQKMDMIFYNAMVVKKPELIPDLFYTGHLILNENKYDGLFDTSLDFAGKIEFYAETMANESKVLIIKAESMAINEIGKPKFIQNGTE